jgi:NitT/TauT family transport system ATP-binding protein
VTHSIEEALYLGNTILVMGEHMGEIKYRMENPYFGFLYPENLDYLVTKKFLRENLRLQGEKVEEFEQNL